MEMAKYKVDMVLMLYTIVIGFSFDIFRRRDIKSFQYLVGLSAILCLAGRLLSMKTKFGISPESYNEIFFLMDLGIMITYYLSLSNIQDVRVEDQEINLKCYRGLWLWFSCTLFITAVYRILYSGLELYNIPQILSVLYCLGGAYLCTKVVQKEISEGVMDKILMFYTIPMLIGSLAYCIMRFRFQEF